MSGELYASVGLRKFWLNYFGPKLMMSDWNEYIHLDVKSQELSRSACDIRMWDVGLQSGRELSNVWGNAL